MGIQSDVNEQLIRETKVTSLEEWQKYVVVLFDEEKIKEDLVYNGDSTVCKFLAIAVRLVATCVM